MNILRKSKPGISYSQIANSQENPSDSDRAQRKKKKLHFHRPKLRSNSSNEQLAPNDTYQARPRSNSFDPERARSASFAEVQARLQSLKTKHVPKTMDQIAERGENIQKVQMQAEKLSEGASIFQKNTKQISNKAWWNKVCSCCLCVFMRLCSNAV
ncbi:uncharacterized protein TRIADDRAFT_56689 [Trichoplax adhaerens]|uniref:V-SNARE coiled-coil homology domain-containing protein n=1 Tax=Trichoplax adhaerens TaxID=10228 RepID=B3RWB5_TRIAD|nr:predicted protein [Trichoplax adhaerens]EDV24667.1 predicted protein [Trichoplax adhaerens]|eukprot:XP_002112557.1 predicted protein [Trichoplax adhaerens]